APGAAGKPRLARRVLTQPAPNRPGAAAELAPLEAKLDSIYPTGKFEHGGKTIPLNDAEDILRESRDPAVTKAVWEGWHSIAPVMRDDYAKLASLANEGSREPAAAGTGAL